MRVALDAPAGAALAAVAAGAAAACRRGLEVELAGPADALRAELARMGAPAPAGLSVVDAPGVVSPEEDPQAACREKPDSSLMRAAEAAATRRCDAFVTGAAPAVAAAAALWHLKRLRGVLKPAL
ncbi:phosphate acyltransferase PlsX, partial [bacterium]